ncbi:MAG: hypothetical protein HZC54_18555 [Verrucomicrobia bacterium]|nr:hypothetical protein [Verrucomicrobiota bacterium]
MKLETGNFSRVARGELKTRNSRSGIALIVTLTVMALLLILGVAFMTNMRSERQVSFNYRRQVEARQAALAGLNAAIAKMSRFYTDAEAVNGSVATMAGRFYYTNGSGNATVTVPSGTSRTAYRHTNMLMFSCVLGTGVYGPGSTNWGDKVNLNGGNYRWPQNPAQSGSYLPIANPSVHPTRAGGAGNSWGPEKTAIWTSYMRTYQTRGPKFAFWIDDESSKINLSNAGVKDMTVAPLSYDNKTTNIWAQPAYPAPANLAACPTYPCAMIVQPDFAKGIIKQISSVDLRMLDVGVVSPGYGDYAPDGLNKWSEAAVLDSLERARNADMWRPFQTPDEVLSLNNALTMNDYQAVKSCLTTYSVEYDDSAQLFKDTANRTIARTNLGVTITTAQDASRLYGFLITTNNLANSASLRRWFNNATFQLKYPGITQPFTNGCVQQIAANIVSYVTDPEQPNNPPYGAGVSGNPTLPTGACGLWKACYMNEIAFSFCWKKRVEPAVAPAVTGSTKYQLWAAMYVELINPYEVDLPRSSKTENYTIELDPDAPGNPALGFTVTYAPPPPTMSPTPPLTQIHFPPGSVQHPIKAHSYSSTTAEINADASPVPWIQWQWPISGIITATNAAAAAKPPDISQIVIAMPKAIRLTMRNGKSSGIIDWFNRAQTIPALSSLTLPAAYSKPKVVDIGTAQMDAKLAFAPSSPAADDAFWNRNNPARISIAKNDPRVHQWYGQRSAGGTRGIIGPGSSSSFGLTLKVPDASLSYNPGWGDNNGQNPTGNINTDGSGGIVDYRGGDIEIQNGNYAPNANRPEYRSNFVIAESGMKSIGELGFIHTGKPWRSLSLQSYGSLSDERNAAGLPKAIGGDLTAIPDWALLDLFSVNTPPIVGRVNINNSGWHLGNNYGGANPPTQANCPTFEDPLYYPNHPNMLAAWPDAIWQARFSTQPFDSGQGHWNYITTRTSSYNRYPVNPIASPTYDSASVPLAAALSVIPDYRFRNKLANYISSRYRPISATRSVPQGDPADIGLLPDSYQPYYTIGQLCEVPAMTNHFACNGTANPSGNNPIAYTDADKEDTLRRIVNVLTTKGDAFTVHVIGQADSGEARLMAVVERVRDPSAAQIIDRNRFRIRQVQWMTE